MIRLFLFFIIVFSIGAISISQTRHIPLNTGWTFQCDSTDDDLPTTLSLKKENSVFA
ncbi:MAG: hypothetical protein JXR53_12745 [Bacteroidales bacterium]|nr:hypothetical protein [Bacteroidales bacterium]